MSWHYCEMSNIVTLQHELENIIFLVFGFTPQMNRQTFELMLPTVK